MNFLLDTHVLLWMLSNSKFISQNVLSILKDKNNNLWVSTISLWEIALKSSLGKLKMEMDIDELVKEIIMNDIELITINIEHIKGINDLPFHHRDPFDKMLISQAVSEKMILLSKDSNF